MSENNGIYFSSDLTDRERACFESGIKLGALYHILCGIPISKDKNIIESIERGIEAAISCQPYVKSVKINLNRTEITGEKENQYDYDEITGRIIQAQLVLNYNDIEIIAKVEWVEKLQYPLMYIEKIRKLN